MDGQGYARRDGRWLARVMLREGMLAPAGRHAALARFEAVRDEELAVELAMLAGFARDPGVARANLDWAPRPLTLVLDDGRRLHDCRLGVPPRLGGRLDAQLAGAVGAVAFPLYHPELVAPARSLLHPGRVRRADRRAGPGTALAAARDAG